MEEKFLVKARAASGEFVGNKFTNKQKSKKTKKMPVTCPTKKQADKICSRDGKKSHNCKKITGLVKRCKRGK